MQKQLDIINIDFPSNQTFSIVLFENKTKKKERNFNLIDQYESLSHTHTQAHTQHTHTHTHSHINIHMHILEYKVIFFSFFCDYCLFTIGFWKGNFKIKYSISQPKNKRKKFSLIYKCKLRGKFMLTNLFLYIIFT